MHGVIRAARRAGLRTGLLSNSWGDIYPRHLFPELFDAVVISAEVGMRKPEERIFRLAAEVLGLEPAQCVFIDDIRDNVAAAQAVGLVGVHHRTARETRQQLAGLLGMPL
jgi:putative hydrolase of the HAD superfamily